MKPTLETKINEFIQMGITDESLYFYQLILNIVPKGFSTPIMEILTIIYNCVYRNRLDTVPMSWNNVVVVDNTISIKMSKFFTVVVKISDDSKYGFININRGTIELLSVVIPQYCNSKKTEYCDTMALLHRNVINLINKY